MTSLKLKKRIRKFWKKSARQQPIFGVLKKIAVLVLLVGLNWAGLAAIGQTAGYFNDEENSSGNTVNAITLDFSLTSPADFSPNATPTQVSSRTINVAKDGALDFEYKVSANNLSGNLCGALNLSTTFNGNPYSGPIAGFNNFDAGQFDTVGGGWQFTATISNDPSLQGQICTFDFVFDGTQIGGAGFSDREIISNTVTSGAWVEPTELGDDNVSPISDSYINQDDADHNYGSGNDLKIKSHSSDKNQRALVKFDFHFPTGITINSSNLKLYMNDVPGVSRNYEARSLLGSWIEKGTGSVTWNNQPTASSTPTAVVSSGMTDPVWLFWNVTGDVQDIVDGTAANYGWLLKDSVENSGTAYEAKFNSRENNEKSKGPVLEVNFSAPPATTDHVVINEVYSQGNEKNEWVELYNPTPGDIDLTGWRICDNTECDSIGAHTISAKGFAVIVAKNSDVPANWTLPLGAVLITLSDTKIGNGLRDDGDGDKVELHDNGAGTGMVIDAMSYGDNHDHMILPKPDSGRSLARIVKGYDTNSANDWVLSNTPNPGTNPSGDDGVEVMRFTSDGIEVAANEEGLPLLGEQIQPQQDLLAGAASGIVGAVQDLLGAGQDGTANPAPVASESVEPLLSPEASPEVLPEVTPEPADDGSSIQVLADSTSSLQAEPAIPAELVTPSAGSGQAVEPPTDPPAPEAPATPADSTPSMDSGQASSPQAE